MQSVIKTILTVVKQKLEVNIRGKEEKKTIIPYA